MSETFLLKVPQIVRQNYDFLRRDSTCQDEIQIANSEDVICFESLV